MTGKRRSDRRVRAAKGRIATVFAALLAVFLQAFVVQTHIHAPLDSVGLRIARAASDYDATTRVSLATDQQRFCPVCEAMAVAGAATLPTSASVLAMDAAGERAILALSQAPRPHTHSWRSRAPPSFL